MAALECTYTLSLNENEAAALKKLLGAMTDDQFAQFGIRGDERKTMSQIWGLLPDDDE